MEGLPRIICLYWFSIKTPSHFSIRSFDIDFKFTLVMLYYILTFQLACELMWVFCRKIDTHIVIGIIWSFLSSQNGKVLFEKIDTFNVHDTITKSCFILFDKLLDFTGVNAFVIHGTISYFQGSQSRFFINTLEVFLIRLLEYYQEKFEYQRLVLLQR